jgi:hypothetical protein
MRILLLIALLLPAACTDRRPPAPSAEENQRLDEADQMLNAMDREQRENSAR